MHDDGGNPRHPLPRALPRWARAVLVAPNGSAVGTVIGVPVDGAAVEARIVGVVAAVRYGTLEDRGGLPARRASRLDPARALRSG